jgi:hypothetical protein
MKPYMLVWGCRACRDVSGSVTDTSAQGLCNGFAALDLLFVPQVKSHR